MNKCSLKLKLLLPVSLVISAACTVIALFCFYQFKNIMLDNFLTQGVVLAKNLSHDIRYGVFTEDRVILEELVLGVLQVDEVVSVTILNSEGKLLIQKNMLGPNYNNTNGISPAIQWKRVLDSGTSATELIRSNEGEEFYYIHVPVTSSWIHSMSVPEWLREENNNKFKNKGLMKLGIVQIGLSTTSLNQRIFNVMLLIAGLTIVIIGVSVFLICCLYKNYIRPLETLSSAAQKVSSGDLSEINSSAGRDEIWVLTNTFNFLIRRLKQRNHQCNDYMSQIENMNNEQTYLNKPAEEPIEESIEEKIS